MTNKAYIVANDEQELNVLKKLENNGFMWVNIETLPTKFRFSESFLFNKFPYVISAREDIKRIGWSYYSDDEDNVVYDGRKEEKMHKVTQEFMDELIEWRDQRHLDMENESYYATFKHQDFRALNGIVMEWQLEEDNSIERNNRLIAIIQWLNGEDVFEVEETHKFVVRNNTTDSEGYYYYVRKVYTTTDMVFSLEGATRFDTREEAQEWANSHQVVVEIDEDGNEVD